MADERSDKNLAHEVEEIEQVVNANAKKLDSILADVKKLDSILLAQAQQTELLNKILSEVLPPKPGLATGQKVILDPEK